MRSESLHEQMPLAASLLTLLVVCTTARAITIFPVMATEEDEAYPMVSGNTVVWQYFNSRYGDWDVEGAFVSDDEVLASFTIADFSGDDRFPVIDGNDVVWQNQRSADSDGDVHGARIEPDLSVTRFAISASGDDEVLPWVSNGVAVWQHGFAGAPDWDIRAYNLATGREFAITDTKMSHQMNPAVYVDIEAMKAFVVWQDDRNGNWDIYGAVLDGSEVATTAEP